MKKNGLFLVPLISISLLVSCGSSKPAEDIFHTFSFEGTHCTVNGDYTYTHNIYEKDKDIKYTITPDEGYSLPKNVDGDVSYDSTNGVITLSEIKSDIKVIAVAEPKPQPKIKHTVYLNPNGGIVEDGKYVLENIDDGSKISEPKVSKAGYNDDEVTWYTSSDFKEENIFNFDTDTVNSDLYLHAKWGEQVKYKITIKDKNNHFSEQTLTFIKDDFTTPLTMSIKVDGGYALTNSIDIEGIVSNNDIAIALFIDKNTLQIIPKQNTNFVIKLETKEQEYFNVTASGVKMKYYADSTMAVPLESVKVERNKDLVFYMVSEYNTNVEDYVPPTSLTVKINDRQEDKSYKIESVEGEYKNVMKKVTISKDYIKGDVSIRGDAVEVNYYKMNFPYLIGLQEPSYEQVCFEYDKEATFEFIAKENPASNDELLTADNVFVNLSDGNGWIKPNEYSSGDNVTFEHTTDNKYYLHIKANSVVADVNTIYVVARAKAVPILEKLSWEEISYASTNGYATALFDIGDTKSVVVNSVIQKVRIIDFNKDVLATSLDGKAQYAGITFEFTDTIKNYKTFWNNKDGSGSTNYDFIGRSNLNECLQEKGEIYKKIPQDLMSVIKNVNKKVDIHPENDWIEGEYNTKLFPLSYDEVGGSENVNAYKYYETDFQNRRKKDEVYWLRSPYKVYMFNAWYVFNDGRLEKFRGVDSLSYAVAPAFCI